MAKKLIYIDGQAGTTALQIRERLHHHEAMEMIILDESLRKDAKAREDALNSCDIAVLCLPDEAAIEAVALVRNPKVKILDASSAHRTKFGWVYGLPEYNAQQADIIASVKRVSNPGCYPTGVILLCAPLIRNHLMPEDYPLFVHGSSGYSGGGRQLIERYEDAHNPQYLTSGLRYYALQLAHKHLKEMQEYSLLAYPPLFSPAVVNTHSGMIITIGLATRLLKKSCNAQDIYHCLRETYAAFPRIYVHELGVMPDEASLEIEELRHTDECELFIFPDKTGDNILLAARYDNLGKGASGAAVQNLNQMIRGL